MYALIWHWFFLVAVSVAATNRGDGTRAIMDDFREAYYWLRHNTDENAKIMSWWDYGYQMSGIANRTVLVDNNTWNNTHIATVGTCLSLEDRYTNAGRPPRCSRR